MDITKNGIYIIVGVNGAGKTTLAKKILASNRNICCMMKQDDNQILEHETVLTNITMNEISDERAINFLKEKQLEYLLTKKSKFLSGGEKRLINLLRVVLSNQEVLILDEPSNDLDMDVFDKAKEIIYQAAKNKIVLLITHDDRFIKYDKKLEVTKSKIYDTNEKKYVDDIHFKQEGVNERTIKIKPRKTYFLYIFYLLCMTIFFIFLVSLLAANNEETKPTSKKGTYQLATLYSANASSYDNIEAINTMLIQSATKWNKAKYFDVEKRINEDEYYEEAINLKKNTYQDLIFLEFYNPETKEFMNIQALTMEYLQQNLKLKENVELISDDENYYKNSENPSFYLADNIVLTQEKITQIESWGYKIRTSDTLEPNQIEVDFNPALYSRILAKINQSDVLITEARVKLKEKASFYDFVADNKLYAKKMFIKGYEPELLNAEINQYSNTMNLIKKVLLIISLLLLLLLILQFMYEANYKNSYSTLAYYGYNKKELLEHRKKAYLTTKFKIFSIITTFIYMIIMWIFVHSLINITIIGVTTLFYAFVYIITPSTIKYNIRKAII
ncbi:ATP-binding cassette domain-containing protein [Listeria welshimeri]|uniref:ATP-binding cassette domain-containing protein n=1 Tax=Listeria welshimeri TaxID=1643 RepID=UPI001627E86E|nr:ABC transporter ATP-binding protein [Listeria welshimeri]MBC1818726.1 ATP-binding cassette domain-containing protein [Listeria welshimeri]MBF2379278.1 ATP-binding cassette domain-containing protein [Listeria welshimeri]